MRSIERACARVSFGKLLCLFLTSLLSTGAVCGDARPSSRLDKALKDLIAQSQPKSAQPDKQASTSLIEFFGQERQQSLGLRIATDINNAVKIVWVRVGSPAAVAGLKEGDRLTEARNGAEGVSISYERRNQVSTVVLPPDNPANPLASQSPTLDLIPKREPFSLSVEHRAATDEALKQAPTRLQRPLTATSDQTTLSGNAGERSLTASAAENGKVALNQGTGKLDLSAFAEKAPVLPGNIEQRVKLLANYNVELIVDRSLSMGRRDCPGGSSRWRWCGLQARNLADRLAPYVPKGLTITTFASRYQVFERETPQSIGDLFDYPRLTRGTRLAEPLADRLNEFLSRRGPKTKPLLIAVITDGVPVPMPEPQMVANTLIKASQRLNDPHEVTVVFFQIGGSDYFGREFLQGLDNQLVKYGARYDMVKTVSFDRLQQIGLAQALVDAIDEFAEKNRYTR